MRYYIRGEVDHWIFDVNETFQIEENLWEYNVKFAPQKSLSNLNFSLTNESPQIQKKKIYLKKLAQKFFYSFDLVCWKKVTDFDYTKDFSVNVGQQFYQFIRGYLPFSHDGEMSGGLKTKMPGKVVKINVIPGQNVVKGQTLIVLEAMKMENEIVSNKNGTVKEIFVKEGQALDQGFLLMEIDD